MDNIISQHGNAIKDYQTQLKEAFGATSQNKLTEETTQESEFSNYLSEAINKVDKEVANSSNNIEKLITGELDNMHTAMIDMNKSQLVLQTAVQVRNKCVESYNEIKNMQF
ncbi:MULTISPECIES: flagellar hook-basal body complex protein FliE [Vagococcus]|uniref:flagellar hook-basal body complex protein FliE n=1 Tax=Vagococcus TaxID=2737 RepID=UPI002FCC547A